MKILSYLTEYYRVSEYLLHDQILNLTLSQEPNLQGCWMDLQSCWVFIKTEK